MQRSEQQIRPEALVLHDYIPHRLLTAAGEVAMLIARAHEKRFGLSIAQWRIVAQLALLNRSPQSALVTATGMDRSTVSRAVKALLAAGLVERSPNAEDARSPVLALSERGWAVHAEVSPAALAFESALLNKWSAQEIEALKRQLERLEAKAAALAKFEFFGAGS